jgi:hypothetical protein
MGLLLLAGTLFKPDDVGRFALLLISIGVALRLVEWFFSTAEPGESEPSLPEPTPRLLPTLPPPQEVPVPFAGPERAPVHGVEILQQVLATPRGPAPRPEDFREPSGATTPCPSCGRSVEDAESLSFCYHCGAALR